MPSEGGGRVSVKMDETERHIFPTCFFKYLNNGNGCDALVIYIPTRQVSIAALFKWMCMHECARQCMYAPLPEGIYDATATYTS